MPDRFLRNLNRKRLVEDNGAISHEAFILRPGELELSFFAVTPRTQVNGFRDYQKASGLPSGDLPGVCSVGPESFDRAKWDIQPDRAEGTFGDDHWSVRDPAPGGEYLVAREARLELPLVLKGKQHPADWPRQADRVSAT